MATIREKLIALETKLSRKMEELREEVGEITILNFNFGL